MSVWQMECVTSQRDVSRFGPDCLPDNQVPPRPQSELFPILPSGDPSPFFFTNRKPKMITRFMSE